MLQLILNIVDEYLFNLYYQKLLIRLFMVKLKHFKMILSAGLVSSQITGGTPDYHTSAIMGKWKQVMPLV